MQALLQRQKVESANDHARAIAVTIREAERKLRARWPILKFQNTLGMICLGLSFAAIFGSSLLYLNGEIPAWLCIVINAIGFSLLREVEHDLIHNLYFRGKTAVQYAIMFVIWPFLGNYANPVLRRRMHLLHHRSSGQIDDLEEQLIGNGMRFGFARILAMLDTPLSLLFRVKELRAIPGFSFTRLLAALFPVVPIYYALWYTFLVFQGTMLVAGFVGVNLAVPTGLQAAMAVVNPLVVIWVVPNLVRQISLAILSSNNHYFGDVDNILKQTQVLKSWYWLSLQVFTFNFGSTHAIHHFVGAQPFYLRQ